MPFHGEIHIFYRIFPFVILVASFFHYENKTVLCFAVWNSLSEAKKNCEKNDVYRG